MDRSPHFSLNLNSHENNRDLDFAQSIAHHTTQVEVIKPRTAQHE